MSKLTPALNIRRILQQLFVTVYFAMVFLTAFRVSMHGQTTSNMLETGAPSFNALESVELGFVNLSNGNLHLEIPLASIPTRGGKPSA